MRGMWSFGRTSWLEKSGQGDVVGGWQELWAALEGQGGCEQVAVLSALWRLWGRQRGGQASRGRRRCAPGPQAVMESCTRLRWVEMEQGGCSPETFRQCLAPFYRCAD